jgi:DinB family
MVLTKEELIASLQNEVRILVHLAGKVDKSKLDYRPTAKQRSILELLQYMAMMGPTLVAVIKTGDFATVWGPGAEAAKKLSYDEAVAAIQKQSEEYARLLSGWTEAEFRAEVDMFGTKSSRGSILVYMVLGGHAAYRTQLFCYLKSCGREELSTWNLWGGADAPAPPA